MQNYARLPVYQRFSDLVDEIYELTKDFPKDERYGLCDQIRRAVVSISLNIRGSLYELGAILDICVRRGFVVEKKRVEIGGMGNDLLRQLGGYIGYLGRD